MVSLGDKALDMAEAVQLTNEQISKVFRVMQTVGEMVSDRKFTVDPTWCPDTMDDFRAKFCADNISISRHAMILQAPKEDSPGEKVLVIFDGAPSVTTQHLKEYVDRAIGEAAAEILLVVEGRLNPAANKWAEEAKAAKGVSIDVFNEDELVVNITKHELVPKHEPLSEKEAEAALAAFQLTKAQLPRMMSRDPVARYFGLKRGDVVKITRKSETAGTYSTYRQVM